MKAKRVLPVLILIVCVVMSGCSLGLDDENLLQPPKNSGREAAIQRLIEKAAHGIYSLKYPRNGEFRSAIITKDLNADERDEAVAFYRTRLDENIHMLVMYSEKGGWKTCQDFKTAYTEVDSVYFSDYNFDGTLDILAGFTTTGDINELNIFNYNPKKHEAVQAKFKTDYSALATGDFDGDGGSEIITLNLTSADSEATATLFDYDKKKLYMLSDCSMDSAVTKYESITSSLLNDKTTGLAVDGIVDGGYNTQILYYDSNERQLINYPYTISKSKNPTFRSFNVNSCDIDDDKILEFPVIKSSSNLANTETGAPVTSWCSFNVKHNKLSEDFRCMNNLEYGYYFKMPENFIDASVAILSEDSKTMKIYSLSDEKKDTLVLTIKVFDVGTSSGKMKDYSTIENYNQNTFAYKIGDTSVLYIDDKTVKENFALNDAVA